MQHTRYIPVLRSGFALWTLGAGLNLLFNQSTPVAVYVVVLAIEGAGVGFVHQPGKHTRNSSSFDRVILKDL